MLTLCIPVGISWICLISVAISHYCDLRENIWHSHSFDWAALRSFIQETINQTSSPKTFSLRGPMCTCVLWSSVFMDKSVWSQKNWQACGRLHRASHSSSLRCRNLRHSDLCEPQHYSNRHGNYITLHHLPEVNTSIWKIDLIIK